jgi:catechol 2,3-dioxygenase-like lactoylglutathione lyase family enzyme
MPTPIVFEDVAPVVPVRDLQAALERYRQLGFEVRAYGHGTGYGFARRGAVSIHLSEWDEHDPKRAGAVVYLYVSDADAVRAEWASCGVEGRLGEARNTDYGMREFGFVDTDGNPAPSGFEVALRVQPATIFPVRRCALCHTPGATGVC